MEKLKEYEKKIKTKLIFGYNEELLNKAHELFNNDKEFNRWNLEKIILYELKIQWNIYSKVKKDTIQRRFNVWKPIYKDKNGSPLPNYHKKSSIQVSRYYQKIYNELYEYFKLTNKTKITKYRFNNFLIERFFIELGKDKKQGKDTYKKYLKPKQEWIKETKKLKIKKFN